MTRGRYYLQRLESGEWMDASEGADKPAALIARMWAEASDDEARRVVRREVLEDGAESFDKLVEEATP